MDVKRHTTSNLQWCHQLSLPAAHCSSKMQTRSGLQGEAATSNQSGSEAGKAITSMKLLISAAIKIPQRWGNKDLGFPSPNTRKVSAPSAQVDLPASPGPNGSTAVRGLDARPRLQAEREDLPVLPGSHEPVEPCLCAWGARGHLGEGSAWWQPHSRSLHGYLLAQT